MVFDGPLSLAFRLIYVHNFIVHLPTSDPPPTPARLHRAIPPHDQNPRTKPPHRRRSATFPKSQPICFITHTHLACNRTNCPHCALNISRSLCCRRSSGAVSLPQQSLLRSLFSFSLFLRQPHRTRFRKSLRVTTADLC